MARQKLQRLAANEVQRTLDKLPPDLRASAQECQILLEDEGEETDLLGLFEGNNRLEPPPAGPEDMPRVTLFLLNLWDFCGQDERCYRREVRKTLLHELGHYLGWDEAQVAELGLE